MAAYKRFTLASEIQVYTQDQLNAVVTELHECPALKDTKVRNTGGQVQPMYCIHRLNPQTKAVVQ